MDWKGADLVIRRRAAKQVQTGWNRNQERYDKRGEAIRAAEALGLPYTITAHSVIVGLPPKRPLKPPKSLKIPTVTASLKPVKRTVMYAKPGKGQVARVRRTSREDIEW